MDSDRCAGGRKGRWPGILPVFLAFLSVSCSDNAGSPTGPDRVRVLFEGDFRNAEGRATILAFRVTLDGEVVSTATTSPAAPRVSVRGQTDSKKGRHTASLVILRQTSSPNTYIGGSDLLVFDGEGRFLRNVSLEERTQSLHTLEGITYAFDL